MTLTYLSSIGQNAGRTLDLSNGYVTFANAGLSSKLSDLSYFTIEMWIKPTNVQTNQKLFSKVTPNFQNGYILGMENGQLDFEIFADGDKEQLKGGSLTANVWQHIAVTFWSGNDIKIYVNGELATSAESTLSAPSSNTNPLVIGAAAWDNVAFRYSGEMDEIRFWSWDLSQENIAAWMNKEAVQLEGRGDHLRLDHLGLYLKCDEATGNSLLDSSPEGNPPGDAGIRLRKNSTVPFKGSPAFVEGNRSIGGVWEGKESFQVGPFQIVGQNFTGDQSAVVEENIATTDFCNTAIPSNIAKISCLRYHVLAQNNPKVSVTYNLDDFNLFGFKDVVLLESDVVDDFSDAKIIAGSSAGGEFTSEEFTISGSQKFYAIGFLTQGLSVDEVANSNNFNVYPNPTQGKVTVEVKDASLMPEMVTVLDIAGKQVYSTVYTKGASQLDIDLSDKTKGIYFVRILTANGNYTKRVTVF